jgi:hypothetical protein
MADRYVPPGAKQAAAEATKLRASYGEALARIRKDPSTSQAQKRRELDELRARYLERMDAQRRAWNDAWQGEQDRAIRTIMRPTGDGRALKDSYHTHRRLLRDASVAQLAEELDWAEVSQDTVLLEVVAALSFQRMTPVPGDVATTLFERVINQRLPHGSFLFGDKAGAYQRWLDLRLSPEEHMAATAVFSTSGKPEPVQDPTPVDPRQQAADKIAQMFPVEGDGAG